MYDNFRLMEIMSVRENFDDVFYLLGKIFLLEFFIFFI